MDKEIRVNIMVISLTFLLPIILMLLIWGLNGNIFIKLLCTGICMIYVIAGIWFFGKDNDDNSNPIHKTRNRAP